MPIPMNNKIIDRLKSKQAKIAILGLGYVGLPLATVFAEAGFEVVGIDPDSEKVEKINQGQSYVGDVPGSKINSLVKSGKLKATTDFSVLKTVDAVSICVPTPLRKTGDPDLSYIISATEQMVPHLHQGMVIVLESTTYPRDNTRDDIAAFCWNPVNVKLEKISFLLFLLKG